MERIGYFYKAIPQRRDLVQQSVICIMRVSAVFYTAARCCNTANSSLTIDGKFEIMNKRIGSGRF